MKWGHYNGNLPGISYRTRLGNPSRVLPVLLVTLISVIFCFFTGTANLQKPEIVKAQSTPDSTLTVSLITCMPGSEVYELCGHEAIRVRGAGIDSVWNYGVFDFNEPNFLYRFVKGETDYMVVGYPFSWFLPEYMARGSEVVEQDLNLTPQQAQEMLALLHEQSLPQNCRYRYNYLRNNCATKIVDIIDTAVNEKIIYKETPKYESFRDAMRQWHENYPWYQFGIDLVLGSGLDVSLSPREGMFIPMEMMRQTASAKFQDGRPLVKAERILNEGRDDAVLGPTPWYLTPIFCSIIVLIISIVTVIIDNYRHAITPLWYAFYFALLGIAGCLVTFLVFFSDHAATSPNILIFWLNPLQLIVPALIWTKKTRKAVRIWMWLNVFVLTILLVVWPFQKQSANPTFLPLVVATLILAAGYAIITSSKSYKKKR